jgi:hypothetical protein
MEAKTEYASYVRQDDGQQRKNYMYPTYFPYIQPMSGQSLVSSGRYAEHPEGELH